MSTETTATVASLFLGVGGTIDDEYPAIHSAPRWTAAGTPYLSAPGIPVMGAT